MIDLSNRQVTETPPLLVRVVGIGGAGANALDRMLLDGRQPGQLLAIHTDLATLGTTVVEEKFQLGPQETRGLGSGGDPETGRRAAAEVAEELRPALEGHDVVFLLAGLGGGTGSGATPVVAEVARDSGALVVAIVTLPFTFEGERRRQQAHEALEALRGVADLVLCFENDRMGEKAGPQAEIAHAFTVANQTMGECVQALTALLGKRGLLHLGYDDLRAALTRVDPRALFGYGEAHGDNRAYEVVAEALRNPMMERGQLLSECSTVMASVVGGPDLALSEVQLLMEEFNRHIGGQTRLLFGVRVDPQFAGRVTLTVISALGEPVVRQQEVLHEARHRAHDLPEHSGGFLQSSAAAQPTGAEGAGQDEEAFSRPPATHRRPRKPTQETLKFEPVTRGRFAKSEPTIVDGQDLDVPTYLRYKVQIRA